MFRVLGLGACLAFSGLVAAAVTVGDPAPDFTLRDANGQNRSLAEFGDGLVVLEWTNHDCPFVRKHYGSGNMQRLQQAYTAQGVAWLTLISSAPGKQGHVSADEAQRLTREREAHPSAVLFDPEGRVGRAYGARTTPHMFVIRGGTIRYAGAIDSIPSADSADVGRATNYVAAALDALLDGQTVPTPTSRPYGCSVKY